MDRNDEGAGTRRRQSTRTIRNAMAYLLAIAHETTDALTLSGHARTPSGCKSGDIKRTIIKKAGSAPTPLPVPDCEL
jgi:hypothetical protein